MMKISSLEHISDTKMMWNVIVYMNRIQQQSKSSTSHQGWSI